MNDQLLYNQVQLPVSAHTFQLYWYQVTPKRDSIFVASGCHLLGAVVKLMS